MRTKLSVYSTLSKAVQQNCCMHTLYKQKYKHFADVWNKHVHKHLCRSVLMHVFVFFTIIFQQMSLLFTYLAHIPRLKYTFSWVQGHADSFNPFVRTWMPRLSIRRTHTQPEEKEACFLWTPETEDVWQRASLMLGFLGNPPHCSIVVGSEPPVALRCEHIDIQIQHRDVFLLQSRCTTQESDPLAL